MIKKKISLLMSSMAILSPIVIAISCGSKGGNDTAEIFTPIAIEDANKKIEGQTSVPSNTYNNYELPAKFALPSTITEVKESGFYHSKLNSEFAMPGVTKLEDKAFAYAVLNENFSIASVTSFGKATFAYAIIQKGFAFPTNISEITESMFSGASLPEGFTIPSSVAKIDDFAFRGVIIPSGFCWNDGTNNIDDNTAIPQKNWKIVKK